jgi:hypothetical protein
VDILRDQHLGSVVLLNRLTGAVHYHFMVNELPVLLEHVPPYQLRHMWFMRNGAPVHFLRTVRQHLNQTFGEEWIGRGGPVNWPYLNPLEFWLRGHLKTSVCSAPIIDLEVLQQRVENVCQEI